MATLVVVGAIALGIFAVWAIVLAALGPDPDLAGPWDPRA